MRHEELTKHIPDTLELGLRAVCGVLAGVIVGLLVCWKGRLREPWEVAAVFMVAVLGCVYGAAKYGDDFWWGLLGAKDR